MFICINSTHILSMHKYMSCFEPFYVTNLLNRQAIPSNIDRLWLPIKSENSGRGCYHFNISHGSRVC